MALLRDVQNLCPKEVLNFILDLIKYNDNGKNKVRAESPSSYRREIMRLNPCDEPQRRQTFPLYSNPLLYLVHHKEAEM